MSGAERLNLDPVGCAKRVWVLSVLSDDEALDDPRDLPRGLSFHLSRCDSCRALADRLLGVTESLGVLGSFDAPEELVDSANRRARSALHAGGRPTGRVRLEDSIDLAPPGAEARGVVWLDGLRYAAAAAVVLAAATFGLSAFRGESGPKLPLRRSIVVRTSAPRSVPASRPSRSPDPAEAEFAASPGDAADERMASADPPGSVPSDPATEVEDGLDLTPDESAGVSPALVQRRARETAVALHTTHHRRPHSHVDATLCGDPRCVPKAMVLPGGARRMLQSRPGPFDNRPAGGSTGP